MRDLQFGLQGLCLGQPKWHDRDMRYVIVITIVAFSIIWDGLYNQGQYLDKTVRTVKSAIHYVTG